MYDYSLPLDSVSGSTDSDFLTNPLRDVYGMYLPPERRLEDNSISYFREHRAIAGNYGSRSLFGCYRFIPRDMIHLGEAWLELFGVTFPPSSDNNLYSKIRKEQSNPILYYEDHTVFSDESFPTNPLSANPPFLSRGDFLSFLSTTMIDSSPEFHFTWYHYPLYPHPFTESPIPFFASTLGNKDKKALQLLEEHLTKEQWEEFNKEGKLTVIGSEGGKYTIRRRLSFNIISETGKKYCLQPKNIDISTYDCLLAVKVLLETDESKTIETAHLFRMDLFSQNRALQESEFENFIPYNGTLSFN